MTSSDCSSAALAGLGGLSVALAGLGGSVARPVGSSSIGSAKVSYCFSGGSSCIASAFGSNYSGICSGSVVGLSPVGLFSLAFLLSLALALKGKDIKVSITNKYKASRVKFKVLTQEQS